MAFFCYAKSCHIIFYGRKVINILFYFQRNFRSLLSPRSGHLLLARNSIWKEVVRFLRQYTCINLAELQQNNHTELLLQIFLTFSYISPSQLYTSIEVIFLRCFFSLTLVFSSIIAWREKVMIWAFSPNKSKSLTQWDLYMFWTLNRKPFKDFSAQKPWIFTRTAKNGPSLCRANIYKCLKESVKRCYERPDHVMICMTQMVIST